MTSRRFRWPPISTIQRCLEVSAAWGALFAILESRIKNTFFPVNVKQNGISRESFFLRNSLLTYNGDEIEAAALQKVIASLSRNGFLIIGSHEQLPFANKDLYCATTLPYVFRRS